MRHLAAGLAIAALALTGCAATASTSSSGTPAAAASHGAAATAASGTATAATGLGGLTSGGGPAQWVVHGTFETQGGSAQPLSGMVTFRDSATGRTVNVTVSASGKFSLGLAAGTYAATGTTVHGDSPCTAPVTVTVRAGQLTQVSLICKATQ
jgi:hypothetical protein